MQKKSLILSSWNINGKSCGNHDKFSDQDFKNTIIGSDIVCLMETHCDLEKCLELENFKSVHLIRPKHKKSKRRFGGLSIYVRSYLRPGIKFLKHKTNDYIWLHLSKQFFGMKDDIFLCYMYNPPSESPYTKALNIDYFEILESDISNYSESGKIIIGGDLNCRTGREEDYIINDNNNHYLPLYDYQSDGTIPSRKSMDSVVTTRGRQLNELCIQTSLKILNGRHFGDSFGQYTSHQPGGSSVIDYFIVSEELIPYVHYFKVHKYDGLMSDHCCISMMLNINCYVSVHNNTTNLKSVPIRYKWNVDSMEKFQTALRSNDIVNSLNTFMSSPSVNDVKGIDELTDKFCNIIKKAADASLCKMIPGLSNKKKCKVKCKWYDKSLLSAKNELRHKQELFNKFSSNPYVRSSYFLALKRFRKLRKNKHRAYKQNIINKLDLLYDKDPKVYWKLLDEFRGVNKYENTKESSISPQEFFNHFQGLNTNSYSDKEIEESLTQSERIKIFNELDYMITNQEIVKAISGLKKNKASSFDSIINEMFKYGQNELTKSLEKLFNNIFSCGIFPSEWGKGYIFPIFKKGNKDEVSNYRGITINSCVAKLFTKILNNRLEIFLNQNNIIFDEQIGFTKNKRTTDHMFVLKTLIDKHTCKGSKPLYTCFIDFKGAFDSVWHQGLFYKLRNIGISDKFYRIIKSMYSNTSLCVKVGNMLTNSFDSNIGVRQGDNLSPNLFKIFVNDFISLIKDDCDPVKLHSTSLNCLFYADDLVLLSSSADGLQNCINKIYGYCMKWKLHVNIDKTKCLTFNTQGRIPKNVVWKLGEQKIENAKSYCYLGITFSISGSFTEGKTEIYKKSLKAYYKFFKSFKDQRPKVKTFLHTFDHTVKSVLLYGSEIWGAFGSNKVKNNICFYKFCNEDIIEKLNIKACKYIIGVNKYSTNSAVMSEIGRFPLYFSIFIGMIKYWIRLENSTDKLLIQALNMNKEMYKNKKKCWISSIYDLLNFLGISVQDCFQKSKSPKNQILKKLASTYQGIWKEEIYNDLRKNKNQKNKLRTFRLFKNTFHYENYLNIVNFKHRSILSKFRVGNHNLEIEVGRHNNTPVNKRICKLCNNGVEDEIHFLLQCKFLKKHRESFIQDIMNDVPNLKDCNESEFFVWLMSCEQKSIVINLCKLIEILMIKRTEGLKQQ